MMSMGTVGDLGPNLGPGAKARIQQPQRRQLVEGGGIGLASLGLAQDRAMSSTDVSGDPAVQRALHWIDEHFDEPVTLERLGAAVGLLSEDEEDWREY